ncbi:amino acid ABC transporter permease [Ornithinimicrobium avium]|uniref:Amino acid ABC transporter permease n=1 Tax=Ornithinimicrobium avium TaxID=2283195 RepID=A0A345NJ14_9MICO|nr:amino acid ABC transporter permease [Ornithinimicrobium avium]AXH95022.1 amino acid ABC transporter permease [Ornithinimicrobium avium]
MSADTSVLFDVPGPRARTRHRILAVVGGLIVLAVLAWVLLRMDEKGQLSPDKWMGVLRWDAWRYYLLPGLRSTLIAAFLAIVISMGLALLLAMTRMSENFPLRWAATIFVEFFRGVPVLIMMLFAFYFLVMMGWLPSSVNPLVGTVTGLVCYNSSVLAEVIRNGVASLPSGQREAGLSIGLSPSQTRRMILIPQSLTAMMPTLVSQVIVITKDSALGYMILYPELVTSARQLGSGAGAPFQAYVIAAVVFIAVNYGIDRLARWVESKQRRRGRSSGKVANPQDVPMVGAAVRGTANTPGHG